MSNLSGSLVPVGSSTNVDPSTVNLLESTFTDITGLWDGTEGAGNAHKNEMGGTAAAVPPTVDPEGRYTQGWTISPISNVTYHGCSMFDAWGVNGMPAKPAGAPDTALNLWFINGGAGAGMRTEYGLDVDTINYWYGQGYKTWYLKGSLCVPPGSAAYLNQNLALNASGSGSPAITTGGINTAGVSNAMSFQMVYPMGQLNNVVGNPYLINPYPVDGTITDFSYTWTITPAEILHIRKYGRQCMQLQMIWNATGHFRGVLINPRMKLVNA